jgi:hypothetical protein
MAISSGRPGGAVISKTAMRMTLASMRDKRSKRQCSEASAIDASISLRRSSTPRTNSQANSWARGVVSKLSAKAAMPGSDASLVISSW